MQAEFLPTLFGAAIDDGEYMRELAVNYSGLALPNTVNSATQSPS